MKAFLISRGLFDFVDVLEQWEVPKFPINGSVVAKAVKDRRLPSNKTKDILESIKSEWANDNYNPDENKLLESMRAKLDQMS
jgi:hypothetical protein